LLIPVGGGSARNRLTPPAAPHPRLLRDRNRRPSTSPDSPPRRIASASPESYQTPVAPPMDWAKLAAASPTSARVPFPGKRNAARIRSTGEDRQLGPSAPRAFVVLCAPEIERPAPW